jgi:hypothetical protein
MTEFEAVFITVKITNAGTGVGQPYAFFQGRITGESGTVILHLESQE